jgi:hypothetical protein
LDNTKFALILCGRRKMAAPWAGSGMDEEEAAGMNPAAY